MAQQPEFQAMSPRSTTALAFAALAFTALLALAACGTNETERVQGGAATGALAGAGVGALGGPVGAVIGGVVGGGAGAITGAATDPSDVNLGRPVWANPEVRVNEPDANPRR
jgi:phage tail tape-measure protein